MGTSRTFFAFRLFAAATVALVLFCSQSRALEPPEPGEIERYRRDGTLAERIAAAKSTGNDRVSPALLARANAKLKRLVLEARGASPQEIAAADSNLPPFRQNMPTTGTIKILVLLIAFQDYPPEIPAADIDDAVFDDGVCSTFRATASVHDYYYRSSYGQLEFVGDTLGWYTTDYPRSEVIEDSSGREALIKEALDYYDDLGHDFSQYDNDDDGVIDYFMVFWTGPRGGWAEFWWGRQTYFCDASYTLDGKQLWNYTWQDEPAIPGGIGTEFDMRVPIHETGHALGLPDLYDYDPSVGPKGGVGCFDMMDGVMCDHNCFSKWLLGWLTPTVVSEGSQELTLGPSASSPDAVLIMPGVTLEDVFDEYFMVQYRDESGNDHFSPGVGMAIWHVDAEVREFGGEFMYDNSWAEHKLVRFMEADGDEEIENGEWRIVEADDFYGPSHTFGLETTPDSRRYDGTHSSVKVDNFSTPGETMSARFSFDIVDSDGDGLWDLWELEHFGDLAQGASDNPDGDAYTNLEEYETGRDPNAVNEPATIVISTHDPGWVYDRHVYATFHYTLADVDSDYCIVRFQYSLDNATWHSFYEQPSLAAADPDGEAYYFGWRDLFGFTWNSVLQGEQDATALMNENIDIWVRALCWDDEVSPDTEGVSSNVLGPLLFSNEPGGWVADIVAPDLCYRGFPLDLSFYLWRRNTYGAHPVMDTLWETEFRFFINGREIGHGLQWLRHAWQERRLTLTSQTLDWYVEPVVIPADLETAPTYTLEITASFAGLVYDSATVEIVVVDPPPDPPPPQAPGPLLWITAPYGGECWGAGTTEDITWGTRIGGLVDIDLYKDGSLYAAIAAGEANDGIYSWAIPPSQPAGFDYRVRITSSSNASIADESFTDFVITALPAITLVSPNGFETWPAGTSQDITWDYNGDEAIDIDLYKGGAFVARIASAEYDDGSCEWLIPADTTLGSDYRIRVTAASDPPVSDDSNRNFSITGDPYVSLALPAGGEIYKRGRTYPVRWDSNAGGSVKLALYRGATLHSWITPPSGTANDGSYEWSVPVGVPLDSNYRIAVILASDMSVYDYNAAPFTITVPTAGSVEVLPIAGEDLHGVIPVTFTLADPAGDMCMVTYQYSLDGVGWHNATEGAHDWLLSSAAGRVWQKAWDSAGEEGAVRNSDCPEVWFRVTSADQDGVSTDSVGPFALYNAPRAWITGAATLPAALERGETFDVNFTLNIRNFYGAWSEPTLGPVNFQVELNGRDLGAFGDTLGEPVENDFTKSLSMMSLEHVAPLAVPADLEESSTYFLSIEGDAYHIGLEPFSMPVTVSDAAAPFIEVTSPNGGEVWERGQVHEITWASNVSGNVKIYLYRGGAYYSTITSDTPSDGSYLWSIPAAHATGSTFRVIVVSKTVGGLYDYSDAAFTIAGIEPFITVTSPNGGESWTAGTTHEITWASHGMGNVGILLYKGTSYNRTIASDTPNDGSYMWAISSGQTTGADFRVVVVSKTVSGLYDYSDSPFTISAPVEMLTLTVSSSGITGVEITGTPAGFTPYAEELELGDGVSLTAPVSVGDYKFLRWKDDGGATLSYRTTYAFRIAADRTVIAEYSDAVTDFYVNDAIPEAGFAAGDNANSGTSPQAPMAGIQALLDRYSIGAPCTVHVSEGTFTECVLITSPSNAGLVIEGASPGATIVVQDPENLDGYPAFYVTQACTLRMLGVGGSTTGLYCEASNLELVNCIFSGNDTAMWSFMDDPVITNCTFYGNVTGLQASRSSVELTNCIFWGNDTEITAFTSDWDYLWVYYCDVEGGQAAVSTNENYDVTWIGNITGDPLFADAPGGDLHLCSTGGRWFPPTSAWVTDAVHSPCIDSGHPASDYSNEPAPNGDCVNIGAYGNTVFASKSEEIVAPFITVTSPDGGESWWAGTTRNVTWESNAGGTVDISLYKGGIFNSVIATAETNDGAHPWNIPPSQTIGADYRVRVTLSSDAAVTDESDADFSIIPAPFITVTAPNGGEVWATGAVHEITWDSGGVGTVKIRLYRGVTYHSTITSSTPNDGSYLWAIPVAHAVGKDFRVAVISNNISGLYDYSDSPFTIVP